MKYVEVAQGWIAKDIFNLVTCDRPLRHKFQAHDLLSILQQNRPNDPEFAYEFKLYDNRRLQHVMWVFLSQKRAYDRWHDTIVFENTYKANNLNMPIGVFTGVTILELSYCVAGALLRDETRKSFEWLFTTFLKIFGTASSTILTDNDLHIIDATKTVLTDIHGTKHSLCLSHMIENIKSNMTKKLGTFMYKQFHGDLMSCLRHFINEEEVEQQKERNH